MPDFTVIDGDEGRGINSSAATYAVQCFEDLSIEMLRDVARDQQSGYRVTDLFFQFMRAAERADVPLVQIISRAHENLHTRAFGNERSDAREARDDVMRYAIRAVAEMMATDGAARARASRRDSELRSAIDTFIEGRELRARAHGWSFLANLSERLGKWTQPKSGTGHPRKRSQPRSRPLEF